MTETVPPAASPTPAPEPAAPQAPAAPEPLAAPAPAAPPTPSPASGDLLSSTLDLLADVELEVSVELGRRRLPLSEVARLRIGSIVELDTEAGDPLVVYANGRRIATGEAVVVDGQLGIRITAVEAAGRAL